MIVLLPKCLQNRVVANWRTIDVLLHLRGGMRRSFLALLLTILLLSSGCLGFLGEDETSDDSDADLGNHPSLNMNTPQMFQHDENVILTGDFDDESPSTVKIQGSISNGVILRDASIDSTNVLLEFGMLPSG